MSTENITIGMIVCRPDGHGIGRVERVDVDAIWLQGHRIPADSLVRLVGDRVYLDPSAGRYTINW